MNPLARVSKFPPYFFAAILILGAILEIWLGVHGFAAQEWPF
jgi:hypothetical protein